MSDIDNLFGSIAKDVEWPPSKATVEADLARGRSALARAHRRRTLRRSMIACSTLAAGVAVVLVATEAGGSGTPQQHAAEFPNLSVSTPARPNTSHHKAQSIKLVAYHGKQLQGFTVDRIPTGWRLSTSTQYALLIDPKGDKDNDPDAFVGKLAVLTSSVDQHGLGKGDKVTVNGQPGVVSDQGKYGIMLTYNDPKGFGVNIQAPADLHWTDQQIVSFAEGVHVTGDAVHSVG
jgi:hypothetical protein